MYFDISGLSEHDCYKLIVSTVVPRPIALVTSVSEAGVLNAAPFSYFNAVSENPPTLMVSFQPKAGGVLKDTARNIRDSGVFVINLVDEPLAAQMNICSTEFPSDVSEVEMASLRTGPSRIVPVPRLADAPISFECRRVMGVDVGHGRMVEFGEVVGVHLRDGLIDPKTMYVDGQGLGLIARMHGRGWYARTTDLFQIERMTVEQWEQSRRTASEPASV